MLTAGIGLVHALLLMAGAFVLRRKLQASTRLTRN